MNSSAFSSSIPWNVKYLKPLKGIRTIYEQMRLPQNRHRQMGGKTLKDGSLAKNQKIKIEMRKNMDLALKGKIPIEDSIYSLLLLLMNMSEL